MTLYRYIDRPTTAGVRVYLYRFHTIRETRCFWIVGERKVKKNAHKQWACATIEEAAVSYKARKTRQFTIYKARMEQALAAMHANLPDH